MGCTTSASNEKSHSKDVRFPKLYKIKRDQDLNQLFNKLQDDLKKLIPANISLNDAHSKLNILLGIYSTAHDTNHLIKTLITTLSMQNKGQKLKNTEFKINEKYPYFSGNKKEVNYGLEISQFLTHYRQYIDCALQNQKIIKKIQVDIQNIIQYLIKLQNSKFIYDEQITYNHTQTKLIQEKINLYYNNIIKSILDDHKYAVQHYDQICSESTSLSQQLFWKNTFTIKKVSSTLLSQAKTETSI